MAGYKNVKMVGSWNFSEKFAQVLLDNFLAKPFFFFFFVVVVFVCVFFSSEKIYRERYFKIHIMGGILSFFLQHILPRTPTY